MKIALVGNQNSGKTTLFNLLTGQNQKIGNWPGVTIEKKSGFIKGTDYEVIDLPGIYSLSPYSSEEDVARRFVFEESPDLIINIVDATNIERSLYLTTQLLELDSQVIIALNMADILEKKGINIDIDKLSKLLKVDIVKISALKKTGIYSLIQFIIEGNYTYKDKLKIYDYQFEEAIANISRLTDLNHKRFSAVKFLEEDIKFERYANDEIKQIVNIIKKGEELEIEEVIANSRYNFIEDIKKVSIKITHTKATVTDKLDKLFLNKWLGLPIFALIMFLVYFLSVGVVGTATVDYISKGIAKLGELAGSGLESLDASDFVVSLVVDGIISGIGAVLNFIPQLVILFICISLLEVTGYMSRISFLLDKIFRKLGLSGKTLIPFIVGSGCSVPGIMSTRTIENKDERSMSILLTPFIPCSAKLPIITLFSGALFPDHRGLVAASLYFFAIAVIIIAALIMKKLIYKNSQNAYITELPEFRAPSIRYVFRDVYEKTISFVKRAGTIILLLSIVVWFLVSFSWKFEYGIAVEDSILASIGNALAWFFYPMLGEWSFGATISAIQGLLAKEAVVSSMAVINHVADLAETTDPSIILTGAGLFSFFTPASAYAFMVFNLFSAPCVGSMGAMKREFGSTKKMFYTILFQTGLAWVLAVLVFLIGSFIGGIL